MIADREQALLQGSAAKDFVNSRLMKSMTIGERVKARREQLRLSTPQLAKKVGGITHQAIQAIENGGGTRHLVSLAKALGVSPEWLQDGTGPPPLPPEFINQQKTHTEIRTPEPISAANIPVTNNAGGVEPLRVMGMVEGGPDGWNLWNGEEIEVRRRPDNLIGVKGAYGVYIRGKSMEPVLHQGWLLHVHPHKQAQAGDYVVVQRRPPHEGDAPLAVVKRFVRHSRGRGGKLVIEQLNPPEVFTVPDSEVVSVHVVVGTSWT